MDQTNLLRFMVSTRDIPPYRDPAVILLDQLKEIYIDGQLEPVDTAQWYPKVMRKDYTVGLNLTGTLVDDPNALLYENYACGGVGNYNAYCNPEIDKLIDQQSKEARTRKSDVSSSGRSSGAWSRMALDRSSTSIAAESAGTRR